MRRNISIADGKAAVETVLQTLANDAVSVTPDRAVMATAVRYLLEELATRYPGRSLEVRVPPYGAVQCLEGPRHTRGTPPNVIETDALTWVKLATGLDDWHTAQTEHRVDASGNRASLDGLVPLV